MKTTRVPGNRLEDKTSARSRGQQPRMDTDGDQIGIGELYRLLVTKHCGKHHGNKLSK